MYGRTVRIFLVDGSSHGIITAEIMNWVGQVTVTPRSKLTEFSKRDDAKKTGVYILVGEDIDVTEQKQVYIGESDNILSRLQQHNKDPKKDFWNQTIIVTSKDENLTKSHIRYLESRLIQITSQTKSVTVSNGTSPETPPLPESDIADMEYFLEQVQLLLPVLGFSFASPLPTISQQTSQSQTQSVGTIFEMINANVQATAQEIGDKFVVLKDSVARKGHTKSLQRTLLQLRTKLYNDGILVESVDGKNLRFSQDVPFSSPSTAAAIVGGTSLNGRVTWKEKASKKTYKEWQEEQV